METFFQMDTLRRRGAGDVEGDAALLEQFADFGCDGLVFARVGEEDVFHGLQAFGFWLLGHWVSANA